MSPWTSRRALWIMFGVGLAGVVIGVSLVIAMLPRWLRSGGPAATAQTGGGSSSVMKNQSGPQAPVGHRQPRAGDVLLQHHVDDVELLLDEPE